ncbi:MAG: MFS transporter [Armatimonadetes bacterium]|nr:MFS transporter [Armatimonadota bacterium]
MQTSGNETVAEGAAGAGGVEREVHRFTEVACIVDAGGYGAGISLFSMGTILPLFVRQLTESPFLIGLIPAVYWAGLFLPQLVVARAIAHLPRLRRYVMIIAVLERVFLALLVPLTLWLWRNPEALLVAFFLAWAGHALSTGLNWVSYFGMVAKIVPATRRGRLFGVAGALGGAFAVAGARLAEHLLKDGGMPYGFVWCFAVGSVVLVATVVPLGFVREPDGEPLAEPPHAGPRQITILLRADPAFGRFVASHICYALAGAAPAFYTVYALEHLGATPTDVARFTAVLTGVTVLAYPLWGMLGDSGGNRRVVTAAAALASAGALLALLAPTLGLFYGVFAFQAAAACGIGLASGNMVLEFGPPARAPTYLAVHSSCTMPAMALAPVVAGAIAGALGYRGIFAAAAALALAASLGWARTAEPRKRQAPP